MNLAAPLGLAAAALAVPLVLWYVLRSRRPRVTVASTFLWRRTDRSVSAAVPWQRLRPDVTFWLVLLALLAGALALARPFLRVPAELGDHTILILDTSASMLADEDGPTRLTLAQRQAETLVDRLGPGQELSVIQAGSRAQVLLSASSDPAAARDALRSLRPTHGTADLVDAFTLAAALERPGQSTLVHLFTDGVVPEAAAAAAPGGLRVAAVGEDRPNLAITRLQAVPLGAGTSQVFVQVRNLGTLAARGRLTLSVDGTDVVEKAFRLGPRGTEDEVLSVQGGPGSILRARVEPTGNDLAGDPAVDALTVDDQAFAVLAAPREVTVLVAGPENLFLQAALAATPGVALETAETVPTDLQDVDLLVVDRAAAPDAPTVPTLYVAPSVTPVGVTLGDDIELPALSFQAPDHELLGDVDLSEVAIATAQSVEAPALTPIASGTDGPLILAGRLDGTPVAYVAFDLLASNLPLQTAWPVFVANAVSWLAGPPVVPSATAGATITVSLPSGATGATASPPSGDTVRVDVANPRLSVDQVGVWRIRHDGLEDSTAAVAVNPDPAESDLARAHPDPVEARSAETDADGAVGATEGRRSFVRELLIGVLLLVAAEWIWTQGVRPWRRRRRTARARGGAPAPDTTERRPVGAGRR